jgi:hypothetical protein
MTSSLSAGVDVAPPAPGEIEQLSDFALGLWVLRLLLLTRKI